ncbi:MAG TPA: patatin-like phospholipase family protein [Nitrososphaera sp.]|nr:patatin-like phospholipase family protein [Nitrososphaera sp.]
MLEETIPKKQRALVMQGGGALGAYEAGVFEAIYEKIKRDDPQNWKTNLFDIVAGASIGAINAVVLVDQFLRNGKSWENSPDALAKLWSGWKNETITEWNRDPFLRWYFETYWNFLNRINPALARGEAARRYWSWAQLANTPFLGANNLSWTLPQLDYKFLDPAPINSLWLGFDYSPLEAFLGERVEFPIKTSFDEGKPRLLLVGVDVQDCTEAVTFDSYAKADGTWYSEYSGVSQDYKVSYDGIGLQELLASCLFPYSIYHTTMIDEKSGKERTFWDGAFLSNTPLRELLHQHRKYWLDYFKLNKIDYDRGGEKGKPKVPDLDVYIVNLYPSTESEVPTGLDGIRDREIDIKFHDRTKYDEQIAHVISDYIDLIEKLIKLAKDKKASQQEIVAVLDQENPGMKSMKREGSRRKTYREILEGRFKVKVVRIDRSDDKYTIFGKHADFSATTIEKLIDSGRKDAIKILGVDTR